MQDCGISLPTGKKKFSSINAGIQKGDHSSTYYVIMFLFFLGPPSHLLDDLQYCKSSKIAIF